MNVRSGKRHSLAIRDPEVESPFIKPLTEFDQDLVGPLLEHHSHDLAVNNGACQHIFAQTVRCSARSDRLVGPDPELGGAGCRALAISAAVCHGPDIVGKDLLQITYPSRSYPAPEPSGSPCLAFICL